MESRVDEHWTDNPVATSAYREALLMARRWELRSEEMESYAAIGIRLVQHLLNNEGWNSVIVAPLALDPSGIYMELCSVEPRGIERALGGTN